MNLHADSQTFDELISLTAKWKNIPESAVKRDYFIVLLLGNLANSKYREKCVFKGGTSLSKCYPGSIERFSEDIDLTFLGINLNDNKCSGIIKDIEKTMIGGAYCEKIIDERSKRSKSMLIWFDDKKDKIKLEIGSNIRPDPFSKRCIKSYIHEFLQLNNDIDTIKKYELKEIELNVLNIERTFIDKIMAVKRHALSNTLNQKVRHIYDVVRLYKLEEIGKFLADKKALKKLISITKKTDEFYLKKRKNGICYNSMSKYDFISWQTNFEKREIKSKYESLHLNLLYTNQRQNFAEAIQTFKEINKILIDIDE